MGQTLTEMQMEGKVKAWNSNHPVGSKVILTNDIGENEETVTRSEAFIMGGHSAMIQVKGRSGCYLLDRITAKN